MTLQADQMLLHYRVAQKIGAGGMGEVWKAVDTELDREVAVKILPPILAEDADRLARFEREAKVLASLNHPGIAQIYGLHEAGGVRFLAMELVRGEDLAQRLDRGPLSIEDALGISRQVAEALEAAHEIGVIHRDLKPANIVLTHDGGAKVLDFGLAKVFEQGSASGSSDPSLSPTMTSAGTQIGVILGTAAYMSPEQARGRVLDRRTDIWSFGCVVFEALTGRHVYHGETATDTISLILQTEPEWSALPDNVPPRLREMLQRCLEKDPRTRLRDIGEARIEIERLLAAKTWTSSAVVTSPTAVGSERSSRPGPAFLAAAVLAGAVAGAAVGAIFWGGDEAPVPVTRVSIEAPSGVIPTQPRMTDDGRTVVFLGTQATPLSSPGRPIVYVRPLDSAEAKPLPETEGVVTRATSPDGLWLAYVAPVKPGSAQRRLVKIPIDGSAPPLVLAEWEADWQEYVLWLPDDHILVATHQPIRLIRIATDGSGALPPVATELPDTVAEFRLIDVLPDGEHVLGSASTWEGQGFHERVYAVSSTTGAFTKILEDGSNPQWSNTGHLVFSRQTTLLAVRFDAGALEATGGPVTLASGLRTNLADASAFFDLSSTGSLVQQPGGRVGSNRRIAFLDEGDVVEWSSDRLAFTGNITVSHDGRDLATTVMSQDDLFFSIWTSRIDRPRLRQWMKMPGLDCNEPLWHPDGRRLFFHCEGDAEEAGFYVAPLDGSEPPRFLWRDRSGGGRTELRYVHPDGGHILFDSPTVDGIATMRLGLEDGEGPFDDEPLFPDRKNTRFAAFSPDGKLVAYYSDDSGRSELFIAPFSADGRTGRSTLVTSASEARIWWMTTGSPGVFDMAYQVAPGRFEKVAVRSTPALSISDPVAFLNTTAILPRIISLDRLPDGRYVIVQGDEEEAGTRRIELVLNFARDLDRLVP